jgi:hypothetical protein
LFIIALFTAVDEYRADKIRHGSKPTSRGCGRRKLRRIAAADQQSEGQEGGAICPLAVSNITQNKSEIQIV